VVAGDKRISHRVKVLRRLSRSGRPGRVEGTRELVITLAPYIVAYRIIGTPYASSAYCTVRDNGPTTCPTDDLGGARPRTQPSGIAGSIHAEIYGMDGCGHIAGPNDDRSADDTQP
jgi:hypothetical protein